MSLWQASGMADPRRHDMPEFRLAHPGVPTSVYSRSQVALAEQLAAQQGLESRTASHVAVMQERDSELSKEIRELRIASAKEIKSLNHRLDEALQDRAILEVQLEAIRTSSDVSQTEGMEKVQQLRSRVDELEKERNALARSNMMIQQQAQTFAALQGVNPSTPPPFYVMQEQMKQLSTDVALLMDENRRLWLELEESRVALAYEVALRSTLCGVRHSASLHHEDQRSLHQPGSASSSQIHHVEEEALMNSLRQAGAEAASAVRRAADSVRSVPAPQPTDEPVSPGTAAQAVRQQVQQDKGASVTVSISRRMAPNPYMPTANSVINANSGSTSFAATAQNAQDSLFESLPDASDTHLASNVSTSGLKGSGSCDNPVRARLRASGSFQKRLSPSVPTAPSRHNSMVEHARTLQHSCIEQDDEDVRVHFDKYADPNTYDVPPPATPHPSKGVLNPPQSPRSPDLDNAGASRVSAVPHTVTIDAASPHAYTRPVPTTPHINHSALYHRGSNAVADDGQAHSTDDLRPHDRSVSFQSASGSGSTQEHATADRNRTMRCLDRSPGCTPIVSGAMGARVRMHSCPGHDNFAPLKSGTASPGGTPHAHGQGRLPTVRVSPLAAAGHDQFNPLRSRVASPGRTPVRSSAGSARGDASEADTSSASATILPYAGNVGAASLVSPGAPSNGTSQTDQMHVIVVSGPGHDNFNPVHLPSRSPGHTPRHSGEFRDPGPPEVRIVAERGHDAFSPMHAGQRSPGHTPGPPARSGTAVPPGNGMLDHLPLSHGVPGHTEGPFSSQPQPHPEHVTFIASPSHDDFHPLAARNASPGHTPRPSMEAFVASPMHVTFQSEAGHDDFEPIRDAHASPGQTPRRPGVGRGQPPTLCAVCPMPRLSDGACKRVSIDTDVPNSHDCFQPMRMAEASPGHTPKGCAMKVPCHPDAVVGALSDEADGVSCDGGAGAASVRDAAFRALQSSESIRNRLVYTDSTAEDFMKGSALGGAAPTVSVQSHPLQHVQEEAQGSWSAASSSPRHAEVAAAGKSGASVTPAAAPSDLHTPPPAMASAQVRRSVSVAGRFPLQSAASVGNRTSPSPSFSFLVPANNPAGDRAEEAAMAHVGILGLPPQHSGPPLGPEQSNVQQGSVPGQRGMQSRGSLNDSTEVGGSPALARPRSAASGSGPGALVIQPIRSMRDCSHDSRDHRSTAGSRQSSVCGSVSDRRCSSAYR